jgi:hypothetical protein
MADAPQNSVTRDDLRDALAHSAPRRRPTGLLSEPSERFAPSEPRVASQPRDEPVTSEPAWDWDAAPSTADRLELEELREVTAEQRRHIDELVTAQSVAADTERELRDALAELAGAGVMRRRAIVAGLRQRGLL